MNKKQSVCMWVGIVIFVFLAVATPSLSHPVWTDYHTRLLSTIIVTAGLIYTFRDKNKQSKEEIVSEKETETQGQKPKTSRLTIVTMLIAAVILGYIFFPTMFRVTVHPPGMDCGVNIMGLGKAMQIYAVDYDDQYPTAEKWCDLLMEYVEVTEKQFVCRAVWRRGDQHRCSYAINPNCKPQSPNDVVLLFESKGGWNQFGGPEILTFENHEGKGCNVLFNDGRVEFIEPEEVGKLKWEVEQKQ